MGAALDNAKALYLEAIGDGNYVEAITAYSGERYTQHSTPVKDGREGFIEFFADFVERNPDLEIEIVRAFQDGRFVFLHVVQTLNGGQFRYVTADIFDSDDRGRLIEHWDIIGEWVDETTSGRTQVDGPTEPTDLDQTEQNKALVTGFVTEVLQNGRLDRMAAYISTETYQQHNPEITDGLEGFEAFVTSRAERGTPMRHRRIHRVVGCGSFVAVLAEMDLGPTAMAVIDLYRIGQDEGRIVEHWDVMEEIPPRDQWVNSGKF